MKVNCYDASKSQGLDIYNYKTTDRLISGYFNSLCGMVMLLFSFLLSVYTLGLSTIFTVTFVAVFP